MDKAKAYVRDQAKALGLETYSQEVRVRGEVCHNVIAVLPGHTDDRIVIGAHLDHIGARGKTIYNGADDNASGSAAVLALAKRLSERKPGCTIEFHWYTGEEQGLIGSKMYCKMPLVPLKHYRFMLNLDMVGRMEKQKLIGAAPFPYQDVLDVLYDKYLFAERTTWASDTRDSDHSSWWQVGVPAVILHTGLHPDYHRPGDEADKINYEGMVKMCHYAFDLTRLIDARLVPEITDPAIPIILY
jgi:Zn-dependent M28 family amino/carboxypeptidase